MLICKVNQAFRLRPLPCVFLSGKGSLNLFITTVPPATPSNFSSQDEFSTTAVFKWTLTNQNADEGADTFIIQLMYENGAFFRNETFPGGVSERRVSDLIPGMRYSARIFAMNADGVATVGPISFSTTPGSKSLATVINYVDYPNFVV